MHLFSGRIFKLLASIGGILLLTACGGGGGSPGTPLLGANAPQGWSMTMTGVISPSNVNCSGQSGGSIQCVVPGHNDTADSNSGAIIEANWVSLGIKLVDSDGNPISGASVTFSLGSFGTGTTGSYCSTATTTTTPNCPPGSPSGVITPIQYMPGFADATGKVTTPITVTTGSDGRAYATYYPGGSGGVDVVVATAQSGGGSSSTTSTTQAAQSATMDVK